jgi:hypothetical protein
MEIYHTIWLENHPHRSEEWLSTQLKEGFDIHHLDGNHNNNDPKNLVLIEAQDHMLIHTGTMFLPKRLIKLKEGWTPKEDVERVKAERQAANDLINQEKVIAKQAKADGQLIIGKIAYVLRVSGRSWTEIEDMLTDRTVGSAALTAAKHYAEADNRPWPIISHDEFMAMVT